MAESAAIAQLVTQSSVHGELPRSESGIETPEHRHAPAPANAALRAKSRRRTASFLATLAYSAAVPATLYAAWSVRDEQYVVPGTGVGYWIGIAGSVIMLALLLYPLRKKFAKVTGVGSVAQWFRLHMAMGIFGPLLIILHSNFELKAMNSIVATVAMLTVVASGLVGRFLYSKVHRGLYGAKAEAKALLSDAATFKQAIGEDMGSVPETMAELKSYETAILQPNLGILASARIMTSLKWRTRLKRKALRNEIQTAIGARALREKWDSETYRLHLATAQDQIDLYNATIRKAAGLKFYDRLFGWWHVLHLPLFMLLIVAAIVHIIAVHFY